MKLPNVRIRTLMFLVWLSALVCTGVVDVIRRNAASSRVEVLEEHHRADGSMTAVLLFEQTTYWYIGPFPIGRYPIAVLSGVAFAVSVATWILRKRVRMRSDGLTAGQR